MINKPDAILCADLHIRDDQPICRTDNYFQAQERKLKFLLELSNKYSCPIICAGDFFHKARSNKWLEIYLMDLMNNFTFGMKVLPGNHDLPFHNIYKLNESSLGIMAKAKFIDVFNVSLEECLISSIGNKRIMLIHKYIDKRAIDLNYCYDLMLKELFIYDDVDIILSGDNHQTFVEYYNDKILVNPGSMMRMTADQINHKPCVFLYCAEENKVEQVFFPIEENVVIRNHIDEQQEKNKRMQSYIEGLNRDMDITMSFKNNIQKYLRENKIKKSVKELVLECLKEN